MAIIKCHNCGGEISDKTKKCIHCNHIINECACRNCGAVVSLDFYRCPNCNEKIRKKISIYGRIWLVLLIILSLFLSGACIVFPILYPESENTILTGIIFLFSCIANILLLIRLNGIYYYISNILNILALMVMGATTIVVGYGIGLFSVGILIYSYITYFFIRKCIKLKRRLVSFIGVSIVNLVLVIFLVISYFNAFDSNLAEKHIDYLKYAFGENADISKTNSYSYMYGLKFYKKSFWAVTYRDEYGAVKKFTFYDLYNLKEDIDTINSFNDYSFARQIIDDYIFLLQGFTQNRKVSDFNELMYFISIYTSHDYINKMLGFNPDVLDSIVPNTGINFRDINFKYLNPDFYYLRMTITYKKPDTRLIPYTKEQVNKILGTYGIKNAYILTNIYETVIYSYGAPTYCVRGGVEFSCSEVTSVEFPLESFRNKNNFVYFNY